MGAVKGFPLPRSTAVPVCLVLVVAVMAFASCTPDQIEAAQKLGVNPDLIAEAQARAPISVSYPAPRPTTTTTQPAPPPPPPPAPEPVPEPAPVVLDPPDATLERLRNCEAGGDYGAVSYGGWYRGAYQFAQSTWNGVAERNLPHLAGVDPAQASPADQDAMARALYWESGWAPWPTCGAYL